jgi:4,5-DOPA dioxygenase extradiol
LIGHRDHQHAAPTPDHFIPLLYLAGLTAAGTRPAKMLVDGYAYGSLSMTSYTLDADCPKSGSGPLPAAGAPGDLGGEDTNL